LLKYSYYFDFNSWIIFRNPVPKHLQYSSQSKGFFFHDKALFKLSCHLDEREGQSHKSIFSIYYKQCYWIGKSVKLWMRNKSIMMDSWVFYRKHQRLQIWSDLVHKIDILGLFWLLVLSNFPYLMRMPNFFILGALFHRATLKFSFSGWPKAIFHLISL